MFRQFLLTALLRAWLAFLSLMLTGFVVSLVIEPESVLKSDDPYVWGFLFGSFAAAASVVYSLANLIWRNRLWASASYFLVLHVI